jgi:hypothetical protein
MNEGPDDLGHRMDQLRLLATETTDPLAERLEWKHLTAMTFDFEPAVSAIEAAWKCGSSSFTKRPSN